MPRNKRQRAHLKNARLASVEHFKKRKLDTEQLRIDDDQPRNNNTSEVCDISDASDTSESEDREGVWFWNESANETDSDSECSGKSDEELDCGLGESRTEMEAVSNTSQKEIQWNREGEKKLRGGHGTGSRATTERKKKVAKELEREASKTYNIMALWQRNRDLGMISEANIQSGLAKDSGLGPENLLHPLSQVPMGAPPQSLEKVKREQRVIALKDITRLVELVTEQEKNNKERLSPHSNFYRRHLMVQQFLQIQLRTLPSQICRDLALNIARLFGKNHDTSRNIVQWEKSWVKTREIPRRKDREKYGIWMDDEDLKESMRDFARKQGDRLGSYKLVQHLRDYVNPESVLAPVEIKSRTARRCLI